MGHWPMDVVAWTLAIRNTQKERSHGLKRLESDGMEYSHRHLTPERTPSLHIDQPFAVLKTSCSFLSSVLRTLRWRPFFIAVESSNKIE